jgi:hypothetical protein
MVVDYQLGKIYKLVNSVNALVYVGSTCVVLSKRLSGHRGSANCGTTPIHTLMREIGADKFAIILIEKYPCTSKDELVAREYSVMQEMIAQGVQLANSQTGKIQSAETTRNKMRGKNGTKNNGFKRGCVSRQKGATPGSSAAWTFTWIDNGKRCNAWFSCRRYTESGAHGLALMLQERTYPIVPD